VNFSQPGSLRAYSCVDIWFKSLFFWVANVFILPRTDIQSEMTLQSEFKRISLSQHFSNKRKNSIGCACIFISL